MNLVLPSIRRIALACVFGAVLVVPVAGQNSDGPAPNNLFAGDSVRVDGQIGRILSISGSQMTVVSRGEPRCRAGQMHGDAPICDPAPLIRNSYDVNSVLIERRSEPSNLTLKTIGAGVLGAAAFGTVGYFVGPEIGFGKVAGCVDNPQSSLVCSPENRVPADEFERRQLEADQRRGVIFFGAIGGTLTAILVRRLSVGWVQVEPTFGAVPSTSWDVGVTLSH